MKKIFMVIALMAMLMLPLTSFSMTAMEEGDLSSVTGQAGVSINLDARVDLTADVLAWGDADGFGDGVIANVGGAAGNAGWVGLTDLAIDNLRIRADQYMLNAKWYLDHGGEAATDALNAAATTLATQLGGWLAIPHALPAGLSVGFKIDDPTTWTGAGAVPSGDFAILLGVAAISGANYAAYLGAYSTAAAIPGFAQARLVNDDITATPFAPLTIDVATDATYNNGVKDITYVRIGLGSLQIEMASLESNVLLMPDVSGVPGVQYGYELGSLYLSTLRLRVGGGSYIDIFNDRTSGQGVSIYANAIIKDFHVGTLAWGDRDGIDWPDAAAATTNGDLRTDDGTTPGYLLTDYPNQGWIGLKNLDIAEITAIGRIDIDVATDATNWTFVQIGLTELTATLSGLTATAALGHERTNLDQELGQLYVSGLTVEVNGAVKLGARADDTQGVTINLADLTVDISTGLTVSWGDLDGIGTGTTAGYVGLSSLNITGLALSGKVTIDVASITDVASYGSITEMMYGDGVTGGTDGYITHNLSPTFVHIGLGTGNAADDENAVGALGIAITSLSSSVTFANNAALSAATTMSPNLMSRTLGSLYIGVLNVGVNGWIDIAAH